jgi:hypothetical protein
MYLLAMNTLTVLEAVVELHGREVLSDPIALNGALRGFPTPPPEAEITALVAAAGAGAVERMRAALAAGAGPDAARRAAVETAVAAAGEHAEWACELLGAALGFLPHDPKVGGRSATRPDRRLTPGPIYIPPNRRRISVPGTNDAPSDPATWADIADIADTAAMDRRRSAFVAVSVILGVAMIAGVTAAVLSRPDSRHRPAATTGATPGAGSSSVTHPTTSTSGAPGAVDPRAVFTDSKLLAVARPYLDRDGVRCKAAEPKTGERESVSCTLESGAYLAVFKRLLGRQQLKELRNTWLKRNTTNVRPGTISVLRWEYVPGRTRVRREIPSTTKARGDGTRIRWLDARGRPHLYFDEDATGVAVLLSAMTRDRQLLREFWAGGS